MTHSVPFGTISDDELHATVRRLTAQSNVMLADLLTHLGEVELRGIHRSRACASLYTYCIYELRMSEYGVAWQSRMELCVKPVDGPTSSWIEDEETRRSERRAVLNRVSAFVTHRWKSIGGPQSKTRSGSSGKATRGSDTHSRGHRLWTAFARQSRGRRGDAGCPLRLCRLGQPRPQSRWLVASAVAPDGIHDAR